jgi:lon-related putative ATP-dependent protease
VDRVKRDKSKSEEERMEKELTFDRLRWSCDKRVFHFHTTEEISPLKEIIGQERAVKAFKFGLGIKNVGFNLFVAGRPGTGRETATKDFLEDFAQGKPVPPDLCYVNNFQNSYEPRIIRLPAGKGKVFKKDMENFVSEVKRVLPEAFKSEDYASKRDTTLKKIEVEKKVLYNELNKKAESEGFALQTTPTGLLVIPVKDGKIMSEEEFLALKQEVKEQLQKKKEKLSDDLRSAVRQLRGLEGKANDAIQKLNRDVALFVIDHLNDALEEKYKKFSDVLKYLKDVQEDILENISDFLQEPGEEPEQLRPPWVGGPSFKKYEVNVIVDNSKLKGAPVIIEHSPTYKNLMGRIEKEARMGILSTDFTMIRAGSLHKANGGFLVLTVEEVVKNLFSWEALKTALKNSEIVIEEAGERLGFITTKGLNPEPIPLSVKVILIGSPYAYHVLYSADVEFKELFKVKAEFDTTMDRTKDNIERYTSFICTLCGKEGLKHLDTMAVSKILEYSSRLARDQEKLSTRFADVGDIIREANYYATEEDDELISAKHIQKAIEEKVYRSSLIKEKIQEMMERNTILIDTEDESVGQVNGLSVVGMGDFSFGRPSRVTASIGLGKGGIIDIEREAKLGGPIHTKGVLILSGYLNGMYAQDKPLSLSARLVFEQSYGGIEGDSASSTELYALLSVLSGLPIKQGIAVTGSVNQNGEVQAIGGVNEKIEGFYEVCKIKGLTGEQGVIIPESNIKNLMLKEEVVEAVRDGKFHIFYVKTINEGIEILSGVRAGTRKPDGSFEENTVNDRVNKRLREIAERLKEFPEREEKGKNENTEEVENR